MFCGRLVRRLLMLRTNSAVGGDTPVHHVNLWCSEYFVSNLPGCVRDTSRDSPTMSAVGSSPD